MSETQKKNWSEESVATLLAAVGSDRPVKAETVEAAAAAIDRSVRSVASKLRDLDIEVASLAKASVPTFSADETAELRAFVEANEGKLTYKQIAEQFASGKFSAKQVQGKLLALEMTYSVKPAEKVEAAREYDAKAEEKFVAMVNKGAFLEEIAEALNRTVASVRGKALSLTRTGVIDRIPAQKNHVSEAVDPLEALGDVSSLTVEELAAKLDKTVRGVKTMLTRRGVAVSNYDGAKKAEKAAARRTAEAV